MTTKIDTLEDAMKNKGGYMPGVSSYNTEPAMVSFNLKSFLEHFTLILVLNLMFLLSSYKFMKQYILRKT